MTEKNKPVSIFISYSWDSEEHKEWVRNLADRLEEIQEVHVTLDQYDLDAYSDKNHFMEKGVFDSDIIMVVVTESYVRKANARSGGTGIETKMASALHWAESENNGSSKIIPILKDGSGTPRYLKEKIYVDFRNSAQFEKSFSYLLRHLKGESRKPRPLKKYSLNEVPRVKELNRIEDFLRMNYKKRRLVFDKKETTDFSGKNRIKFELWETKSPVVDYFLFLFDNIVITSTIERLCELLKRDRITLTRLTILRPSIGDKGYIEKLFNSNGVSISPDELTYSGYIWDFCIDDDAKKKNEIYQIPFYIDQDLIEICEDQEKELGPASAYIKSVLDNSEQSPAKIIIAPGGTGKTTLCHRIAKYCNDSGSQVSVLIQAEMLKSEDFSGLRSSIKIETVFDLYEVYAKVSGRESDDESIFDRVTFETAILSGNLVLIIDGIDEFLSLFPETFNLVSFLESIDSLNKELCSSKIIITTRSDVFDDELMQKCDELKKYTLRGFDSTACRKYLERRFKAYDNPKEVVEKALSHITPIISKDEGKRILPFVVDLLSTVAEETVGGDGTAFNLSLDGIGYLCRNNTTDYLVGSIMRRESVRQSIEASIDDVMEIFWELAVFNGDTFPVSDLEEMVKIMCPSDAQKILRNPLLEVSNPLAGRFKYDFLNDYFKALYIINTLSRGGANNMLVKLISRYPYGEGEVFKEVCQYFRENSLSLIQSSKMLIKEIAKGIEISEVFQPHNESYRAIGCIVRLISELHDSQSSKQAFTKNILNAFDVMENRLSHIAIYGDCVPLDFQNLAVTYSIFVRYTSFTYSKFSGATFDNCYFDKTYGDLISDSFDPNMFGNCRIGDLEGAIATKVEDTALNRSLVEKELRKYFNVFLKGGRFVDKRKAFFKYSDRVRGINRKLDDKLLAKGVLEVRSKKVDFTYYQVSKGYEASIYSFIANNSVDAKICEIIHLVD